MKQEKYLAKTFALFVFAILIIGMIPIAFAEESNDKKDNNGIKENLGLGVIGNQVAVLTDAEIEAAVTAEIEAETSIETTNTEITEVENESSINKRIAVCVERVMKNHPKASEKRVEQFCQKHLAIKLNLLNKMKNGKEQKDKKEQNKDERKEQNKQFKEELNDKEAKIYAHLNSKIKQWCADNSEECRKRLSQWKLEKAKDKRKITSEKLEKAQERYKEAKEKFKDSEKEYSIEKQAFLDLKVKLKSCKETKEADQSKECKDLQNRAIEHAKKMVSNSIRMLVNHLQKIEERVNENENFNNEEALKITAEIDAKLKLLADLQVRVDGTQTKEDVKIIAKEVQELWKNYKHRAELHALQVANARVKGIVEKSEKIEAKFQCALDALTLQEKDVAGIDALTAKYNEKLANAREHYNQAKVEFKAGIELRTTGNLTNAQIEAVIKHNEEGKRHLEASRENIKEAQNLFKEVVRMIKEKGGDIEACKTKTEIKDDVENDVEVVTENNIAVDETVSIKASS